MSYHHLFVLLALQHVLGSVHNLFFHILNRRLSRLCIVYFHSIFFIVLSLIYVTYKASYTPSIRLTKVSNLSLTFLAILSIYSGTSEFPHQKWCSNRYLYPCSRSHSLTSSALLFAAPGSPTNPTPFSLESKAQLNGIPSPYYKAGKSADRAEGAGVYLPFI